MNLPAANKQWRLASYPEGMPSAANWTLGEGPIPAPGPGEMLARAICLDVAPYMRGRINPQKNYAAGVAPGEVMVGGCIGEVVKSNAKGFDNTAGPITDAAMQNLALRARIVIVGAVSLAARFGQPDIGPRFQRQILMARATVRGFLVSECAQRHPEARERIGAWYRAGALESKFDVARGIESVPQAFLRLLESRNLGKQIVQVSDEP